VSDDITQSARCLDEEERATWMSLVAMIMCLPGAIEAQIKRDSGLNLFEYLILTSLAQWQGEVLRMSQLAMLAGGSRSRLSHAVARLEKQGLVRRRPGVDNDGQYVGAVITEKGRTLIEAVAPGHEREARRLVFDRLGRDQSRRLKPLACEIAEAASPEMARALHQVLATFGPRPSQSGPEHEQSPARTVVPGERDRLQRARPISSEPT
jgi:DNA-binding MarR family transcriptional regulator